MSALEGQAILAESRHELVYGRFTLAEVVDQARDAVAAIRDEQAAGDERGIRVAKSFAEELVALAHEIYLRTH